MPRRKKRLPGCTGKARHPTRGAALSAMHAAPFSPYLNVYHCHHCGEWHVGHQPQHVRRAIARRRSNQR